MSDNTKKAQCIHCFHFFSKDSNSTLKNHISHPHCEALKRAAKSGQSSMSRDGSIFVYNPDVLREQFAGLVIQRGLPFNHFDDEQTTRVFQKHLQPKYNHVSRTTLKRDAMKLWVAAKQAIIDDFLKLNTNVNLTTDVWSAPHGLPESLIESITVDNGFGTKAKERFTGYFQGNPMTNLLNRLKDHSNKRARNDRSTSSEYERYLHSDFISHLRPDEFAGFDVLGFWKAKESMFPILSRMARVI
ncbi:zinc finger BED domain-containing protein RICESLEEPER 2-like protein [Tanacetum coccineum]